MKQILVINGPNLNLLGVREPDVYGSVTLKHIEDACAKQCNYHGLGLEFFQSNHEGAIIDRLHQALSERVKGIAINAGGYTHTSIAIMDALLSLSVPKIEIHISNIYKREAFRHTSYISKAVDGVICGLGVKGYLLAVDALANMINNKEGTKNG